MSLRTSHDGAGARERIHCLIDGLGDPRIAVAPQERVADADANPGEVVRARSRDEAARVDAGGIQRGKAVCDVADAARQKARRVEGRGQRHDAIGRPAPEVTFRPTVPVMHAGIRTEPAVSLRRMLSRK